MFKKQRYTFKVDPVSKKIKKPKIYLCDKQLKKKGEIHPVISPVIKVNLNGADEISFSVKKNITNYNNSDVNILRKKYGIDAGNKISTQYNNINDYSIVLAEGFGYFEVSPTIVDNSNTEKRINGNSLGESELSQLQCKLECNTELDYKTNGFTPTIICSTENKDKSLIHRILSFAPTYVVGEVDDSIAVLQRTFTFDEDIISCFKKISEEINCIFDVIVERDEDGSVIRKVNIYDAQCCQDCGSRNIIGSVCQNQNCGSVNTNQIGEDTTILISTENLSDEITLTPDGNMKNCFIIEGGDDLVTDTIKGLSPSNTNKLYMFSDETISQWSPELKGKYNQYINTVSGLEADYAKTLELKYDIFDLISYLQSSRMPTVQTDKRDLKKEVEHIIEQFKKNFPMGIGIEENLSSASSKNSVVLKTISIFVDKGYSLKQEDGNYQNGKWIGKLIVYESHNSEVKATINVNEDESLIEFSTGEKVHSYFTIRFTNDCESYIKRMVALITESYEYIEEDEDKEWQKYSLNRLYSYYCGYDTCIQELTNLEKTSSLNGMQSKAEDFIKLYNQNKQKISHYMKNLENFLYYLYEYSGSFLRIYSNTPSFQDIDYKNYAKNPDNLIYKTPEEAFRNMVEYIKYGTFVGDPEDKKQNTDSALYCSNCKSTNVTLDGCPQCKRTDTIITYGSLAETILENHKINSIDLETQREEIRNLCDLKKVLGDTLYKEFFSFVREDKYENSNFVSDGLIGNVDLINNTKELIQKAKYELSKACISQHTISGNVHSFVAHSALNKNDFPIENVYDKFRLGNFMRYFADDGKVYKLRLSSEEFSWADSGAELNVEFTDVIRYLGGGISDLSSLIEKVGSLATTANTAKTQADKGVKISKEFQKIKDEGLQSALSNVLSARNIDVQIDERGILLRKYNYDLDDYDQHQMKLINRNIVMTDDSWEHAKLAIGLGRHNDELVYGVWADLLVGDLIVGKELVIKNKNENGDSSVTIDKNGITIKNGAICGGYLNIISGNNQVVIDPSNTSNPDYIFQVKNQDKIMVGIKANGEALFEGEIRTKSGTIGGWEIGEHGISHTNLTDNNGLDNSFRISSQDSRIITHKIVSEVKNNNNDIYFHDNTLSILPGKLEYEYLYVCGKKNGVSQGDIVERSSLLTMQNDMLKIEGYRNGKPLPSNLRTTISVTSAGVYIKSGKADSDGYFYDTRLTYDGLQIKGKFLGELYSVVTTGENIISENDERTNQWIQHTANFDGVAYEKEPIVNVMFEGQPSSENIVFDGYIIVDHKYAGFYYSVWNAPGLGYHTKWWAAGNVNRY